PPTPHYPLPLHDALPISPSYSPPASPQWPGVTPFCLQSGAQFQPPPPPALTSPEYTAAFNQVKELGSFDSTARTADQTEAAMFRSEEHTSELQSRENLVC